MNHKPRIYCIVVTYNRKDLLLECLNAIYSQTYPANKIILINNASTDGTEEALKESGYFEKENFDYHLMQKNLGCSGGFYEGINIARDNADWIWIMDDDTIPAPDALENLVNAVNLVHEDVSFFASCVYGPEGQPMNVPGIDSRPTDNGYSDWYKDLSLGLVKIRAATFVSILLNSKAIHKCGLPCRDYFIWGDDTEYTLRFTTHYGSAYLVGKSEVCHKRALTRALSIMAETDKSRVKNYFYLYRNSFVNDVIYFGKRLSVRNFVKDIIRTRHFLHGPLGFMKFMTVLRGTISGWLHWRKFDSFIKSQLQE
ncbi:MAG: glycosyltransferase family 2 protein [Synergistaceae bacterium]|nr:glycosyltransferase family 2 protein [Synergistaceae bacterium]